VGTKSLAGNKTRLGIIGAGVAAESLLFHINQNPELKNTLEITQFASERLAPACSTSSTSTVFLNNTERGISPLGDLIVDAFEVTKDFIQTHNPEGVSVGSHYHLCHPQSPKHENYQKRYSTNKTINSIPNSKLKLRDNFSNYTEEGFIFYPDKFLNWLREKNQTNIQDKLLIQLGEEETGIHCRFDDGTEETFDKLVLCTGAYTKTFESTLGDDDIKLNGQIVQGSYLSWKVDSMKEILGTEGISLSLDDEEKKYNLIYRDETNELLVGSTSNNVESQYAVDAQTLETIYTKVITDFPDLGEILKFEKATVHTGLRHKGRKRMPYWGKWRNSCNVFAFHSLYKNGYSFNILGGIELANTLANS